jgi:hypothetical protein
MRYLFDLRTNRAVTCGGSFLSYTLVSRGYKTREENCFIRIANSVDAYRSLLVNCIFPHRVATRC